MPESQECILLSMPCYLFEEAGMVENDLLQMTALHGKIVIEKICKSEQLVCSGGCENCPCVGECSDDRRRVK